MPIPEPVDRFAAEGKGRLTKWNQDMRAGNSDCPIVCSFMLDQAFAVTALQRTADTMKALTGLEFTPDSVYEVGERVNNLARVFNVLSGLGREEDHFPERLLTEPVQDGESKGQFISREEQVMMLDEYYEARGWTREGVPTEETLKSLRLDEAARMLAGKK